MAAHAFACRSRFNAIRDNPTSFEIEYQCIIGDGIMEPWDFAGIYTYDALQTPAANLTAFKNHIVAKAAENGITLLATNVMIDITLQ